MAHPTSAARWVIWVTDDEGQMVPYSSLVPREQSAWLREVLNPHLTALADDTYLDGHVALMSGASRWSYAVTDESVHWVVEYRQGLLVTLFGTGGSIAGAWFSLDPSWLETDDVPMSYSIVFDAWDSQFDASWRAHHGFVADDATGVAFERIMQHAQWLQRVGAAPREHSHEAGGDWIDRCLLRLEEWAAAHEVALDADGNVRGG